MKNFFKYSKDFTWALGLNRFGLRLIGIWPINEDLKSRSLKTVFRVPCMIFIITFGIMLPQIYAFILVISNLQLVIDNLTSSFAAFISCIKLFIMWRSKKELQPVMQSVIKDWLRPKNNWELKMMKQEALWGRIYTITDYVILLICYLGFIIGPVIGCDIRTISNITDYGDRHLVVQSYYPYNHSKSPQFELTNLFQMVAGVFIGMSVSIPDHYFGVLVFHTSAQFSILGNNITYFIEDGDILAKDTKRTDIDKKLGLFIERHIHLIGIVSSIEKSFSFVIASQVFCMSVMVLCLGFQIICILDNTSDKPTPLQIITLTGTLFYMMLHTFVHCFASESLAKSSSHIFFNIYCCYWYTLPKKNIRSLIPMMIISKNPLQIKAGKLFVTSFETYCNIIKTLGGYISMLIAASRRSTL